MNLAYGVRSLGVWGIGLMLAVGVLPGNSAPASASGAPAGAAPSSAALASAAQTAGAERDRVEKVCRLDDSSIAESSGLVIDEGMLITTNDSGDGGRLFVVDQRCETVATIEWSEDPEDVEALAPGPAGTVWVGDIGDNDSRRDFIVVNQVRLSDGQVLAQRELRYPGGPQDAEALLTQPGTGRLFIATKGLLGGELYAVPPQGERLRAVGELTGLITDGAFVDRQRLVVRTYAQAIVYRLDPLTEIGRIRLPDQDQGEAIAVDAAGEWWLTSEGTSEPVWRIERPLLALLDPTPSDKPTVGEPSASADAVQPETPDSSADPSAEPPTAPDDGRLRWWLLPIALLASLAVWLAARRTRRPAAG